MNKIFPLCMKFTFKIIRLFVIMIISVSVILISTSFLMQDKISDIIIGALNKKISTKLDVGSFKLSFIRKFPKASLDLKDVVVHSTSNYNSHAFPYISTDTLLAVRKVSVEFRIYDILKGNYNIERMILKAGMMNLFTDTAGHVNYEISVKNSGTDGDNLTINLEKVNLTDIKINYYNLATKLMIGGLIKEGKLKSRISGDNIDFTATAETQIYSFLLYNKKITKPFKTDLNLALISSRSGIEIKKGNLNIENWDFGLNGNISHENILDFNIIGNNIDLSKIRSYLPEKYQKLISEYNPSGILNIHSTIRGPLTRTSNPHIEIYFFLDNGHIAYGKSNLAVDDLSFSGFFSNGSENLPETSSILIKDFKANLGSSQYTGSFMMTQFDHPRVKLKLKGRIIPQEVKEFFNLMKISTSGGYVDLNIKLESNISIKEKYTLSDIVDMNPEADLVFNSFTIGLKNNKIMFNQVNGNLSYSDSVLVKNFQFTYNGQRIKIDGEFRNFPDWLAGKPVKMIVSADVMFSVLYPEQFLKNSALYSSSNPNQEVLNLPDDIILDINYKIDTLIYKSLSSSEITGFLSYRPRLLTFISLNMNSLSGMISGNGFIAQNKDKTFTARADVKVTEIDVNRAFKTFHNFGQDFIKAENITGRLSGSLSFLLPMDSTLIPLKKSLTAEGKYVLGNGGLINFEPVKQLSSFIELSELENISFEKMENEFYIRNNYLFIPQMDIKSSAADLAVNGKHSFDNDYEYHIKILLSEILSKKRKIVKRNNTEFGVVEDDGLGRTSLLLKIENIGNEFKVGYDVKALSSGIKNNLKKERQSLKNILNEEYGWYKNDSTAKQKTPGKSRFRINWEENDSVSDFPDPSAGKKESIMKSFFRKK
jgi:hypothetical protein